MPSVVKIPRVKSLYYYYYYYYFFSRPWYFIPKGIRNYEGGEKLFLLLLLLFLFFIFQYPRYLESPGLKAYTKNSWND